MQKSLLIFVFLFTVFIQADEMENKGKDLFLQYCNDCHQQDGNSDNPKIPKIAGFSAILIYDIIDQYKSEDRKSIVVNNKNNEETTMNTIAKKLQDSEIQAIAYYLSRQSFKATPQKYDENLAKQGEAIHIELCENCHVESGSSNIEDTPILRGQWEPYLGQQFKNLTNETRYIPRRMKNRFRKLTDENKKALIEFYISP